MNSHKYNYASTWLVKQEPVHLSKSKSKSHQQKRLYVYNLRPICYDTSSKLDGGWGLWEPPWGQHPETKQSTPWGSLWLVPGASNPDRTQAWTHQPDLLADRREISHSHPLWLMLIWDSTLISQVYQLWYSLILFFTIAKDLNSIFWTRFLMNETNFSNYSIFLLNLKVAMNSNLALLIFKCT